MSITVDLFVPLAEAEAPLHELAARAIGRARLAPEEVRLVRRSLDARKGRPLGYNLRVEVQEGGARRPTTEALPAPSRWPLGRPRPEIVVIGSGPAGAFAALRLAEAGLPCTILERGKPVQPRRRDLATLQRGVLNPDSNYCFGEGGAGTYSDGKLYTRAQNARRSSRSWPIWSATARPPRSRSRRGRTSARTSSREW